MLPMYDHSVDVIDLFMKLNIFITLYMKVSIEKGRNVYLFYFIIMKMHHIIKDDIGLPFYLFQCEL
jgi:hypothetical protein